MIAIENVRLFDEVQARTDDLTEALEQQTATSEVLQVISSSAGELEPVFQAMLENATRICGAQFGMLWLAEGDGFRTSAMHNLPAALVEERGADYLMRPDPDVPLGRVAATKRLVHIADMTTEPVYLRRAILLLPWSRGRGAHAPRRTHAKEGELVGMLAIYRQEVRPFTEKQIELVHELRRAGRHRDREHAATQRTAPESLQQQTATADMLKLISRSAFDLQGVLDTLTRSAAQLCEAEMAGIVRPDGGEHYWTTAFNFPPDFMEFMKTRPIVRDRGSVAGVPCSKGTSSIVRMYWRIPTSPMAKRRSWAATGRCSRFRCCAKATRSASSC